MRKQKAYIYYIYFEIATFLKTGVYIYIVCTDPATDIYQGACSRVSRAYISRRMHLPQDLLLRRRVSPCGFFRAQRLHFITCTMLKIAFRASRFQNFLGACPQNPRLPPPRDSPLWRSYLLLHLFIVLNRSLLRSLMWSSRSLFRK